VLLLALATAGCNTNGQGGPFASAPRGSVAFEAIDGPPTQIFRKLVAKLGDEAEARRIAVVSREAPAQYRVRAYVAAQIHGKGVRNTVAWVWDVYDADERRVVRLSGEEPAGPHRRDAWNAADEKLVARIAQNGMQQLAEFINAPGSYPAPAPAPERDEPVVVASAANGSGGLRLFGGGRPSPKPAAPMEPESAEADQAPITLASAPVPRPRPERTLTPNDLLTYANHRR
jgi:hypothetical protein